MLYRQSLISYVSPLNSSKHTEWYFMPFYWYFLHVSSCLNNAHLIFSIHGELIFEILFVYCAFFYPRGKPLQFALFAGLIVKMTFFKEVENASLVEDQVSALESYVPNSVIYVILYLLALPPNMLLFYMGAKKGLITSRVKYPTLGIYYTFFLHYSHNWMTLM